MVVYRANDFLRSRKIDGIRGIYPAQYTQLRISKLERERHFLNPLISLCFSLTSTLILLIVAFAATLPVLIAADAVYTCDRGIFPFRKSIAMTSFSLTIFSHFYFKQLFPLVRNQFRYTTHAQTLCK